MNLCVIICYVISRCVYIIYVYMVCFYFCLGGYDYNPLTWVESWAAQLQNPDKKVSGFGWGGCTPPRQSH